MPEGVGWFFLGPLIAVGLVGFLCLVFWQLGLQWSVSWDETEPRSEGLAILGFSDDYGLLRPAAVTDDAMIAEEIRRLLNAAGIRATQATGADGRLAVLVFGEELDAARRLVGGSTR